MKTRLLKVLIFAAFAVFCLSGCGSEEETKVSKITYTIKVETEGGMPLSDTKLVVYEDSSQENLVWAAETDDEGIISFEAVESEDYVAVIEEVSEGFCIEETYSIAAGDNQIQVELAIEEAGDMSEVKYELGSVIKDHIISTADGNECKISELLAEKKAVILNFWFHECAPCRMEFPFMQEAYAEYQDDIEILALNPLDGTEESILSFADEYGLTFPMGVGELSLAQSFDLNAFPTTVVIDRYGMICMIHTGSITDKETFTQIFDYFISEDYEQATLRNLSDLK